jgi:multidrug efflux system outer membrane protein
MRKTFCIFFIVVLNSCIGYKEPNKELTDNLKKDAISVQNLTIPDQWIVNKTDSINSSINLDWIKEIKDGAVNTLIAESFKYNSDLNISKYKLEQVRLYMGIAASNLVPTVDARLGTFVVKSGDRFNKAVIDANWEIDLWGKLKSQSEASKRDYFSAQFRNERLKQTIEALIIQNYYLAISGNVNIKKYDEFIAKTNELRKIVVVKRDLGYANDTDVSTIDAELNQLEVQYEKIKNATLNAKRSLQLLMGRYPNGEIEVKSEFPVLGSKVPTTLPLQLLENRPDILASHYQIEKAFFEIQEAKATRLPAINIGASLGMGFTSIEAFKELYTNPLINVAGGLFTPIFNAGKLKRNLEIKNAQQQELVEVYSKQVLYALNEVETVWGNLNSIDNQTQFTMGAINELNKNIKLNQKQIDIGTSNYYVLIQKQREVIDNEIWLTTMQLQNILERINLYMALGVAKF